MTNKDIQKEKDEIRTHVLVQCEGLDMRALADSAVEKLSSDEDFLKAKIIFAYNPFGHEIPFVKKLREKFPEKKFYYPEMDGKKMHFEYDEAPDLIFVPAIAVDKDGNRLGRGWGCYDTFLSSLGAQLPSLCIVPECAVVDKIAVEPHDVAINKIIICKQ